MVKTISAAVSAILARGVRVYVQETAPTDLKGLWIDPSDLYCDVISYNRIWLSTAIPTEYSEDTDRVGYAYADLKGSVIATSLTVRTGDIIYCGDGYVGMVVALVTGDINVLMVNADRIKFTA